MKSRIVKFDDQEIMIHETGNIYFIFIYVFKRINQSFSTFLQLLIFYSSDISRNITKRINRSTIGDEVIFNRTDINNELQTNRAARILANDYDKINFVYRNPGGIHSSYMYFRGLKAALERNDLLYYSYDVSGKEPLDIEALLKYPILCITGSHDPVFDIVQQINGRQFIAEINPESLHTRQGDMDKRYYGIVKDRSGYFDMYFTAAETDLDDYFGKPCYWMPSWAHTELLDNISQAVFDKLGFIGHVGGREDFFAKDLHKILLLANTISREDSRENLTELCKLINKFKILVTPPGVRFTGMTGKTFEYMACNRLCLCYLNEDYMFKTKLLFKDGEDIVFFKTFKDMEAKYNYYLKNYEAADKISKAGYDKVRKFHNADVRARRFAELVLHHANGGQFNSSFNDVSVFCR